MTRRGGLVLAGGLLVGVLGPACAPTEKDPVVTVAAAEPLINDGAGLPAGTNPTTTLTITVLDELEQKGTGVVRVTTKVGMFGAEGNNTLVTLSDGSATLDFTCPVAKDPACATGVASISADWRGNVGRGKVYVGERGKLLMSGSSGGSRPPPIGGGDPTETGTVSTFVPSQVYLFGSLHEDVVGAHALSSVTQPMKHFIGFPPGVESAVVRPNGELLHSNGLGLYKATPDDFVQIGQRTDYPVNTTSNDTLLSMPCTIGSWNRYSVHPATGEVFYQCGTGTEIKSQLTGAVLVPADTKKGFILMRVGHGGMKLLTDSASSQRSLFLMNSTNASFPVDIASNPNTGLMLRRSIRARSDGFYFVYYNSPVVQLWKLGNTGTWSRVGIYPDTSKLPTGYTVAQSDFVVDGGNNAHVIVKSATGFAIARFPLGAGTPTIVYDEKNRPADAGWDQWPPKLFNMISSSTSAFLVTSP
jgi:hypothetical protein